MNPTGNLPTKLSREQAPTPPATQAPLGQTPTTPPAARAPLLGQTPTTPPAVQAPLLGQAPTTPPAVQAPLLGQEGKDFSLPSFSRRGGAERRGGYPPLGAT